MFHLRAKGCLINLCLLLAIRNTIGASNNTAQQVNSEFQACPGTCLEPPEDWAVYGSLDSLTSCEQTILFDYNFHSAFDGSNKINKLRACVPESRQQTVSFAANTAHGRGNATGFCHSSTSEKKVSLDIVSWGSSIPSSPKKISKILSDVQDYLGVAPKCDSTFISGYFHQAIVGVYSGSAIEKSSAAHSIIPSLARQLNNSTMPQTTLAQLCGKDRNAEHTFGVVLDTAGNMENIQRSIKAWGSGHCVSYNASSSKFTPASVVEKIYGNRTSPGPASSNHTSTTSSSPPFSNHTSTASIPLPFSNPTSTASIPPPFSNPTSIASSAPPFSNNTSTRGFANIINVASTGTCKTAKVASGDSCATLASKCGISAQDFTKYNPNSKLCSSLQPGQLVCCSSGTLPDVRPKPQADGTCATYLVKTGDTCSSIATSHGLKTTDLSKFNDKTTWGWYGCADLLVGSAICLSTGDTPMPAPVSNAVCGPMKPGTKRPKDMTFLSISNPCPLNACCDVWGQCGITPEFCTAQKGPTGNPGTAPKGKNGCISFCGTDIKKNLPGKSMTVGYYEAWNWDRTCLNMRAADLEAAPWTHAHYAFASISDSFVVSVNDTYKQWSAFAALKTTKRIISLGGWGFSTSAATYDILRKAMEPANADAFVISIVKFIAKYNLDGVDIDWEYPGAPDIPGTPPGLPSDGPNYLAFLKKLRSALPKDRTVSIAAPASYWYLKAFPIREMGSVVDYIVYMTYDLHGQWDYGNKFSQEGCPGASCLRSHVNLTETNYALAMLTKAGVPANRVVVGVSSYGRAFGMTSKACTGPTCGFQGPKSGATPGRCTNTAGYLANAEILEILSLNDTGVKSWYDKASDSNIVQYKDNQWVAYMDDDTKEARTQYYKDMGFLGTVDWAVDLQDFTDDGDPSGDDDDGPLPDYDPPSCTATFATIEDLDGATNIPDACKAQYIVSTLSNVLNTAIQNYTAMMKDGYDGKFKTFAKAVSDSAGNSVHDFVTHNGNKYFSCTVTETSVCCDYCKDGAHPAAQCNYCFQGECYETCNINGCSKMKRDEFLSLDSGLFGEMNRRDTPTSTRRIIGKPVNESEPCPPDYSKRGYGPSGGKDNSDYEQSVYWSLNKDKSDMFYADLLNATGIPKNKTTFGNWERGNGCPEGTPMGNGDDCWANGFDFGIPVPNGYSPDDVSDPKDIVEKALNRSTDFMDQINDAVISLMAIAYPYNAYELVDAVSLPVLMVVDAVENMQQVVETADKIDEEKRKALIMAFLGAIFFFIPIAGEVLGAVAELGDIAAIVTALGVAGNTALDIYTIVDDPHNAPLAILSLIMEPLALASVAKVSQAANIRRGMSEDQLGKLSKTMANRMHTIQKVTGSCARRP